MDEQAEVAHKRETWRMEQGHWFRAKFRATHPMISYESGVVTP